MSDPRMDAREETLPIDSLLPQIVDALRRNPGLVISAPPGAGKTTRVPRALFEAGFADSGEILILEPRRLAARLAALRVAAEFGEDPGNTVGYTIRFEHIGGPQTRVRFLTEGILARKIVQDPSLAGVSTVILDEFHERHLNTDVALAFLRRLQLQSRPNLKLVVMSATLDAAPIARFLGEVPVLKVEGRRFETTIEYETKSSKRALHDDVASAIAKLLRTGLDGDILVFLPGAGEIRRAAEVLRASLAHPDITVVPLHGDLSAADQARAVEPAPRRKVILATNVAETSVTIPGVGAVVDSGLARRAGHSPWSGLPTLALVKISKASAEQRAGRAGRTQMGKVVRLYTRMEFEGRIACEPPEIKRTDLAETVLMLAGAGVRDCSSFPWFDPPPQSALKAAQALLMQIGAFDSTGSLTDLGRAMLRFPLHPRLARMMAEGEARGIVSETALLAALVSERDIRLDTRNGLISKDLAERKPAHESASSDLIEVFDRFNEARRIGFVQKHLVSLGLDPRAVQTVERVQRQILHFASQKRVPNRTASSAEEMEESLRIALLAGFPDRVAMRRARGSNEFICAHGGSARLSPASVVHQPCLIVAIEAEERSSGTSTAAPRAAQIHLASAIEPEWLAALFPHDILERVELIWNPAAGRVDQLNRTTYYQIDLEERVRPAAPSEAVSRVLTAAVLDRGPSVYRDGAFIPTLLARLALLRRSLPEEKIPEMGDREVTDAFGESCILKRSFAELSHVSLSPLLLRNLTSRQRELLQRETPESLTLPGRRSVKIHYGEEQPPWIESRLQDFFGMVASPLLCAGRVPVTVHLLAPNGRPVQVTQDLSGFWTRHYPALRRELQRRYPKHAWPEQGDLPLRPSFRREIRGKQ